MSEVLQPGICDCPDGRDGRGRRAGLVQLLDQAADLVQLLDRAAELLKLLDQAGGIHRHLDQIRQMVRLLEYANQNLAAFTALATGNRPAGQEIAPPA